MAWEHEMIEELKTASHGSRSAVIGKYATLAGKSPQTVWRIAAANGYRTQRQKRSDAGQCVLSDDQIAYISGLIYTSRREIKGTILPVEDALQIAEDNGVIDKGCISVPRLQAILRERGQNAKALNAPSPHIQMRSLHPNHVHIWDVSVCIQYYLKNGELRIMDERKFYKNKPDNYRKIKQRLLRYVLSDHYSNCIYIKYYYAGGETQLNLFDFLMSAWGGDKHEKFGFRGVPFYVLMDAGAANISGAMREFMERLDIKLPKSLPHNPRRQGSAEKTQQIVETKFEARLRFQPAHSISELNEWAMDWMIWYNNNSRHARHGMTRMQAWLSIRAEQLRELPDMSLLQDIFANPKESRKVSGRYSVSYRALEYDVRHIPGIIPGLSQVEVILRPFVYPTVGIVFNGEEYSANPITTTAGGFRSDAAVIGEEYKRMPDSQTQKAVKTAENLAYGDNADLPETKKRKQTPFAGIRVFGNLADKVSVSPIPRSGVPHAVTQQVDEVSEKRLSILEFLGRLRPVVGTITPDLNRMIRARYGTAITVAEAQRLVEAARMDTLMEAITDDAAPEAHTG